MTGLQKMTLAPMMLMVVSFIMGCNNYEKTKDDMQHDLNQALRMMVMDKSQQQTLMDSVAALQGDMVLTLGKAQDVLTRQLTMAPLINTSHVSLCLVGEKQHDPFCEQALLCSDTLLWMPSVVGKDGVTVALKAYANPSWLSVLSHSRQRLPLAGMTVSMAMLLLLAGRSFRAGATSIADSPSSPDVPQASSTSPKDISLSSLRLTPMQQQLMELFVSTPDHLLSKDTICAALWPKKDRPEDTLYTFVSRLKVTLRQQSDLDIVNIRGREYQLVGKDHTMN